MLLFCVLRGYKDHLPLSPLPRAGHPKCSACFTQTGRSVASPFHFSPLAPRLPRASRGHSPLSFNSFRITSFADPHLASPLESHLFLKHRGVGPPSGKSFPKRIDRKDAIAIAYMSQLLLNTLTPLEKQLRAEQKAARDREFEQRLAEIKARRARESAAAAPTPPQTAPPRLALPSAPSANAAPPDPGPPQPPKTYADVRT